MIMQNQRTELELLVPKIERMEQAAARNEIASLSPEQRKAFDEHLAALRARLAELGG